MDTLLDKLVLVIIALFCPPIPVLMKRGLDVEFVLSIALVLIAYFPGLIYAIWIIFSDDEYV